MVDFLLFFEFWQHFMRYKFGRKKKKHYFCPAFSTKCCCSSVVEHFLGKEEVTSSSLVNSSKERRIVLLSFSFNKSLIINIISHYIISYIYIIITQIEYIHFLNSIIFLIFTLMKIE